MKRWKKTLTTLGIMGLSALLLFVFPTLQVYAKDSGRPTYNVNCDLGQSIQDAVDRADDGSTINVYGTCTETVLIEKNRISLVGQSGSSISAPPGSWAAITVQGSLSQISNLEIINNEGKGIVVNKGGSATIKNNVITNVSDIGIVVWMGGHAEIEDNVIKDTSDGISVFHSSNALIVRNTIEDTVNTGISIGEGSNGFIADNSIMRSGASGIWIGVASSGVVKNNSITGSAHSGVGISQSSSAHIIDSTITGSTHSGVFVDRNSSVNFGSWGGPNILEGNGNWGVYCGFSGVLEVGTPPDFGGGNTNGNTYIDPACQCIGDICP